MYIFLREKKLYICLCAVSAAATAAAASAVINSVPSKCAVGIPSLQPQWDDAICDTDDDDNDMQWFNVHLKAD